MEKGEVVDFEEANQRLQEYKYELGQISIDEVGKMKNIHQTAIDALKAEGITTLEKAAQYGLAVLQIPEVGPSTYFAIVKRLYQIRRGRSLPGFSAFKGIKDKPQPFDPVKRTQALEPVETEEFVRESPMTTREKIWALRSELLDEAQDHLAEGDFSGDLDPKAARIKLEVARRLEEIYQEGNNG